MPACTDAAKPPASNASGARQDRPDQHRSELCAHFARPRRATPQQLATLLRNHWQVENRLHYVMCVTLPTTKTAGGRMCATCRAIWPA